jgi:hypothetical protein
MEGGLRDAEWHSFSVNATHGYPRDRKDVERILRRIFSDPEWSPMPLRGIARHTNIPWATVQYRHAKFLSGQVGQIKPAEREVTRGGTSYTMNTEAIGRACDWRFSYSELQTSALGIAIIGLTESR